MHPAFSVIFLTTLIGVGQGLFLALFTAQLYRLTGLLEHDPGTLFYQYGSLLALCFLALGLFSSVFHLGRPERAWRTASRWRSSWLSREVIALPLTMVTIALYALLHYLGLTQPLITIGEDFSLDPTLIAGTVATVMVFSLFICTSMIYAAVRFIQQWHTPLTVLNFTLFGIASGFMVAALLAAWMENGLVSFFGGWAVVATTLALFGRSAALYRNHKLRGKSSLQSAIGVRHTIVTQKAMGFVGDSFNTREFFHHRSPRTVTAVRNGFLLLLFPLPLLLLTPSLVGGGSLELLLAAFGSQYLGLLAERWYFFAEAKHPQNLYYQTRS
ncbi:MAG: dimethyl sulfoxide reductase anchor subunit [Gammaproteobacteria bacterium]|nr:dimethyl sulfoxide reductase anchor subunit [Gammaproteobacteria bacterium]